MADLNWNPVRNWTVAEKHAKFEGATLSIRQKSHNKWTWVVHYRDKPGVNQAQGPLRMATGDEATEHDAETRAQQVAKLLKAIPQDFEKWCSLASGVASMALDSLDCLRITERQEGQQLVKEFLTQLGFTHWPEK